jgi:hypothetical protein
LGSWADKVAMCAAPDFICKLSANSAACVANPPYYVGESTALPSTGSAAKDFLFAVPIALSSKTRVLHFGIVGRGPGAPAAFVKMALYSDVSAAPAALLGYSDEVAMSASTLSLSPIVALNVNPGNYWLVAIFSQLAPTWEAALTSATSRYAAQPYATAFPGAFPASTLVTGTKENFFVYTQDQP